MRSATSSGTPAGGSDRDSVLSYLPQGLPQAAAAALASSYKFSWVDEVHPGRLGMYMLSKLDSRVIVCIDELAEGRIVPKWTRC